MKQGRIIALGAAAAILMAGAAGAGVVKTKTKSNQSNDRCAGACPLPRNEVVQYLESEFDLLDADKDGQLEASEQAGLMHDAAAADARGAPLKGVDVKIGRASAERILQLRFSASLDRDGDGRISRAEWLADSAAQFDLADSDHDGALSQAEAVKFGWNVKSTEVR